MNDQVAVNQEGQMEHREGEICAFIPPPFSTTTAYEVPPYPGPERPTPEVEQVLVEVVERVEQVFEPGDE
jgi:hypothetical protein